MWEVKFVFKREREREIELLFLKDIELIRCYDHYRSLSLREWSHNVQGQYTTLIIYQNNSLYQIYSCNITLIDSFIIITENCLTQDYYLHKID